MNAALALDLANPSVAGACGTTQFPICGRWRGVQWLDFGPGGPFTNGVAAPYNNILTASNSRLRVVVAWDATARSCNDNGGGCQGEVLDADIDLRISKSMGSSWQVVCTSTSYDSSWELCDIPVALGEVYKVELLKYQTNSAGTYLGIAWNNYDPTQE